MRELWPDIRELILPRRSILALGFVLMVINRLCGLVLPASTKFLIDNVIGKHQVQLLAPLVRRRARRHADPGHHVVLADAAALEGRASG